MTGRRAAVGLVAALATLVLAGGCGDQPELAQPPPPPTAAPGPAEDPDPDADADADAGMDLSDAAADDATLAVVPEIVEQLSPSVVTIVRPDGGLGSGVVYRADGLLVTNAHVVGEADGVTVVFADGTRVEGEVVARDRSTDLAVVRVDREGLPVPEYAAELPDKGELAVAIGSPLGFETTVTVGVVSGLGREIPGAVEAGQVALVDLIQTGAPISPGNSGGALVDGQGRVIGINDAYIPPQAGAVSIGFAIPSIRVVDVVEQLLVDGTAEEPFLGVELTTLTPPLREAFDVDAERGAVVLDVAPDSPAAAAGLRSGDVITRFAGQDVATTGNLLGALRSTEPGRPVPITVVRDGGPVELSVTVGRRSA